MRPTDGAGEAPVAAYELFSSSEILGRMAMSKMLGGLSSRRYPVGLKPVGENVEQAASATSKSAVSRRFVAITETALAEVLAAPLGELDLVALMIDGVHSGQHLCVVALGMANLVSRTSAMSGRILVDLRRPDCRTVSGARNNAVNATLCVP